MEGERSERSAVSFAESPMQVSDAGSEKGIELPENAGLSDATVLRLSFCRRKSMQVLAGEKSVDLLSSVVRVALGKSELKDKAEKAARAAKASEKAAKEKTEEEVQA